MIEIWKDIKGYEGLYKISNLGNIKSLNYNHSGIEKNIQHKNINTYNTLALYKEGKFIETSAHRLVAQTFISNPHNKREVNHINGIKGDNRVENLEWCTSGENRRHSIHVLGNKNKFQTNHPCKGKFGKDSRNSKVVLQYDLDGNFIKERGSLIDASRTLNIFSGNIVKCCKGKRNHTGGFIWKYKTND